MKNALLAGSALALIGTSALAGSHAEEIKIGIILGFTGPIESLTPPMADSAELALKEINDSGNFLDGKVLAPVRADSTCVDSAAATAAAERLVTSDGVVAIMGADCSGVTGAVLANVGDLAGAQHRRGQRPVLPHRTQRRAARRGSCQHSCRQRHQRGRGHLHQQ